MHTFFISTNLLASEKSLHFSKAGGQRSYIKLGGHCVSISAKTFLKSWAFFVHAFKIISSILTTKLVNYIAVWPSINIIAVFQTFRSLSLNKITDCWQWSISNQSSGVDTDTKVVQTSLVEVRLWRCSQADLKKLNIIIESQINYKSINYKSFAIVPLRHQLIYFFWLFWT